ncbi:methionyl-tRNA formyltransferase [Lichenicoccus roseus]|uniref:Methionyl-tRNA formyltransferase n=1 Tax=Lichenicoccus roseus TaxID=2683649 RepID=A0A5R9J895_9PROT|nr:methionyl-tRNA formyltransferase [Lichenicoccus roseus]TLU73840.1 methionyl-tRNA formyltransferase [Lichenicoccus roseus]
MRLAFMGTPDFAVPALRALHQAGHEIAAVYSQPPRPAGRGQALRASPVQREAEQLGLPVRTPARVRRDAAEHAAFRDLGLDAAVVAAYGLILPAEMLHAPRRGCLNIHASLLPRWRGAAPIQAAILAGDSESGVTIMQMDEGLDTGPMLLAGQVPITAATTAQALHDALAPLGASLILRALEEAPMARPQPEAGVTTASRLSRDHGRLDWTQSAEALDRRIRAMTPWPGAWTLSDGTVLKVLGATPMPGLRPDVAPGSILPGQDGLWIACGSGVLRIDRLQLPGRAALAAADFLRGHRFAPDHRLG